MAADQTRQERIGAVAMSFGSMFIAAMEWFDRPEPGELIEAEPDWYVTFNLALHGAILLQSCSTQPSFHQNQRCATQARSAF